MKYDFVDDKRVGMGSQKKNDFLMIVFDDVSIVSSIAALMVVIQTHHVIIIKNTLDYKLTCLNACGTKCSQYSSMN